MSKLAREKSELSRRSNWLGGGDTTATKGCPPKGLEKGLLNTGTPDENRTHIGIARERNKVGQINSEGGAAILPPGIARREAIGGICACC